MEKRPNMKWILLTLVLVISAAALCTAQSYSRLSVVSSPDVPETLSADRLSRCLLQLATEWRLPPEQLPNILVFHVSHSTSKTAFVMQDFMVRKNSGENPEEYYEVWIVGSPGLKYVFALQFVLEDHFRFQPNEAEREGVLARVRRMERATISVQEGR